MASFRDLTGKRFGYLTVLSLHSRSSRSARTRTKWLCKCDCGNEVVVQANNLTSGNTKSCGCYHSLTIALPRAESGHVNRMYNSWRAMKSRCNNPHNNRYYAYGARGIKVCPEWNKFIGFREWALKNGYAPNLTIDRIDYNGDYTPENCRWIPLGDQAKKQEANQ